MRLDAHACWERLGLAGHGVLGTVHRERGVDAVPVVFVVDGGQILIPIDTVKAKSGHRLQRLANLEADPRCVLLVDHYDDDWSQLWWVRLHGHAVETAPAPGDRTRLGAAFPAYRAPDSVTGAIVLRADEITGWAAEAEAPEDR
jgi:PPOX class probable F420-dependent enzyme